MCKNDFSKQVLAQRVQLNSITGRSSEIRQAINEIKEINHQHSDELIMLEKELDELFSIAGLGDDEFSTLDFDDILSEEERSSIRTSIQSFKEINRIDYLNQSQYQEAIDAFLQQSGFSLEEDPLTELLSISQIDGVLEEYEKKYGKLKWRKSDYIMIGLVSMLAILIDFFIVSIPKDMTFKGNTYSGSPLTKAMKEKSNEWYNDKNSGIGKILNDLEEWAKVPYDISVNNPEKGYKIDGLRPALHRLMEPGHDPIVGFVVGICDIMRGKCTIIDKNGALQILNNGEGNYYIFEAFLKVFAHLLSDVFTSTGLPCPFMSLLQLCTGKSPFILRENGEKVFFTDVARFMYSNGYDMRHFATMGVEPLFIELSIRTYYNFCYFDSLLDQDKDIRHCAKKNSMLTATHSVAACGNVVKMWTSQWNPAAFNYTEFIGLAISIIRTIKSNSKVKQAAIEEIDRQWGEIVADSR